MGSERGVSLAMSAGEVSHTPVRVTRRTPRSRIRTTATWALWPHANTLSPNRCDHRSGLNVSWFWSGQSFLPGIPIANPMPMITQETSATAGITHIAFMSGTLRFGARGDGVFA